MALSADEKRWRAESDARTLAESEVIKNDPPRLEEAKTAAGTMAEKEAEEARAMRKVANTKERKPQAEQTPRRQRENGPAGSEAQSTPAPNSFNVFKRL